MNAGGEGTAGRAFVGRSTEVAAIHAFVDAVATGVTGQLLIEAEAGAGKTGLLRHVHRTLRARHPAFAMFESEGDPNDTRALRPIAEALGCRLGSEDPTRRRIAELMLGARDHGPGGVTAAAQELLLDVIERTSLEAPVLLVLDDLQWADDATLAALGSICRRLPGAGVGVLGASRPSPRVRAALAPAGVTTVRLGPFDDDALAAIAADVTGRRPTVTELRALDGVRSNPFLIRMLASDRGAGGIVGSGTALQAVGRMTAGLPRTLIGFLEVAAIAGRELDADLVARALGARVATVVSMAGEAVHHGWLADDGDQVRFRHDLYAEALIAAMPIDRRDAMHLVLGRELGSMGHAPGRAAFHLDASSYLLDVGDIPGVLRVVDALPSDDETVVSLASRAYELDPANGEALSAHLRCLAVKRHHDDVVGLARPWLSATPGDPVGTHIDGTLFAIRMLATASCAQTAGNDAAIALLEEGLATEALTDHQRADYLTMLSRLQWYGRDVEAVRRSAGDALEVSRRSRYPKGEVAALCVLSEAASMLGDPAEALRSAEAAIALSAGLGPVSPTVELAFGTALVSAGRIREGMPVLARSLVSAERSGDSIAMALAHMAIQSGRLNTGDWDGFVAGADAMVEIGRETGTRSGIVFPLSFAALAACRRAQFDQVPSILARLRSEATMGDSHPTSALGSLIGDLAELEAAGRFPEACANAAWLAGLLAPAGFSVQAQVAMEATRLAWIVGDRTVLTEMAALLQRAAELATTPTRRAMAAMAAALVDGTPEGMRAAALAMAATERVWDTAVAHHMAGLAFRADGSRHEAQALLGDAAERYDRLGCNVHAAAARAGLGFSELRSRRHEAPAPAVVSTSASAANAAVDALSKAERRVLSLVAAGHPNADIAAALYVSKRTVESHIASLYRKLQVTTRVALGRIGAASDASEASSASGEQ